MTSSPSRLAAALAQAVRGEVRFDAGSRALYATDASNYRQTPIGVVIPRSVEDVVAAVRVCREHGAVLRRAGLQPRRLAERVLAPAVRRAGEDTLIELLVP